jgi:hypothetical protein
MITEAWRNCTKCWIFKEWSNFCKSKKTSTWYKERCKACEKKRDKLIYIPNKKVLEKNTRWEHPLLK